jgi:hypothetical protein
MFSLASELSLGQPMEPIYRRFISFLFTICLATTAVAQDWQPDQAKSRPQVTMPVNGPSLTGKERMGRKWMDDQRIDNCNVPIDKRGSKPRPGDCLHLPSG